MSGLISWKAQADVQAALVIFVIALAITAVSIPWVRKAAVSLGFVDAPARRKLHSTPIPLMGGVAIFAGAMIAILFFAGQLARSVTGVGLALSLVAVVGLIDDRRALPAWVKLGSQFLAFLILAYFGVRVQLPIPEFLNYALTFVWLAGISNAINFLDNMDGLSAGVSAVAASFMLLLGLQNDQFLVSSLAAAILGSCLGFLRYNFSPAQIFMGDAGSLFLGFSLALLGIQLRFPANVSFVTWMVPVFILGLPIFDTTLVVVSRLRRGVSPNTAGKDHVSHRLVRLGYSQREAVLVLYLVSGIFGMIALFVTQATILEGYLMAGVAAVVALFALVRLERIPTA
ncbi:MAG: undecaprenyl/decaprenyl-phosphate alpha-N-acetylglucosaminyl 1-phosphate transferase [Anaerolineales bacterium]|nr:undecaprenyl/decaprenyl-phosphate alpha-N-acetylglucosaminyl 1-phosphate transferase [Anaerolineales bacterium]